MILNFPPFLASSWVVTDQSWTCSGALITKKAVLTAGHCICNPLLQSRVKVLNLILLKKHLNFLPIIHRLLSKIFTLKDCEPVDKNQHNAFNKVTVGYGMKEVVVHPLWPPPERKFRKVVSKAYLMGFSSAVSFYSTCFLLE